MTEFDRRAQPQSISQRLFKAKSPFLLSSTALIPAFAVLVAAGALALPQAALAQYAGGGEGGWTFYPDADGGRSDPVGNGGAGAPGGTLGGIPSGGGGGGGGVIGGNGGDGGDNPGSGGAGGSAAGQNGADGKFGPAGAGGGGGGGGAHGAILSANGNGNSHGGNGGRGGGYGFVPSNYLGGGGGGGGGWGVVADGAIQVVLGTGDAAKGGNGGRGGIGGVYVFGPGGQGGAGGHGAFFNAGGGTLNNLGSIEGGAGGAGGDVITSGSDFGGDGGGGGDGVVFIEGAGTLNNQGSIEGGAGGEGGFSIYGSHGGAGHSGGHGVRVGDIYSWGAVGTTVIANSGTITGGNGGRWGDSLFSYDYDFVSGPGGYGLVGSNITLANTGTISGGVSGDGVRASALALGGTNTITDIGTLIGRVEIASGTTTFDFATDQSLANVISGRGSIAKSGVGTLVLTGANSFSGGTTVNAGSLLVNGSLASGVTVNGGTLGGSGTIAGLVTLNGGTLAPGNSPGTITIGSLAINAPATTVFELGQAGVAGGASNDLIRVTGNLALNGGAIQIDRGAGFGAGQYTLFEFGSLTGGIGNITLNPLGGGYVGGLALGTGTVLLNAAAAEDVVYWNGSTTSPTGAVVGGDGTWTYFDNNFTDASGGVSGAWAGNQSLVVFGGTAGTVTIGADQALGASGLYFLTDGYVINAGNEAAGLGLAGPVGIDTPNGVSATINTYLVGVGSLTKTGEGSLTLGGFTFPDAGLFVLAGTVINKWITHGTVTNYGTIENLGRIYGAIDNRATFVNSGRLESEVTNSGTLRTTGVLFGRLINSGTANLAGRVNGDVANAGTIVLTGATTGIANFTQEASGTFDLGGFATTLGSLAGRGTITLGSADLTVGSNGSNTRFDGVVTGAGGLAKAGSGVLTLAGANTFSGTTTVGAGTLVLASGGTLAGPVINNAAFIAAGRVAGLVTNNGVLVSTGSLNGGLVNGARGSATLAGAISGTFTNAGAVVVNSGTTLQLGDMTTLRNIAPSARIDVAGTLRGRIDLASGTLIGRTGSLLAGDLLIGLGATFMSSGAVTGNVTVNGTLLSGNAHDTLTVNGTLALGGGSTTVFEITDAASDRIVVNGTASIAPGATLVLTGVRAATPGQSYSLITATDGLSGHFTTIVKDRSIFGFIRQDGDSLDLSGTLILPANMTGQGTAAVNYLNERLMAGTVSDAGLALTSALAELDGTPIAPAIARLSPEPYASAASMALENGLVLAKTVRTAAIAGASEDNGGLFVFGQGVAAGRTLAGGSSGTASAAQASDGYLGGIGYGTRAVGVSAFVGRSSVRQEIAALATQTRSSGIFFGGKVHLATGGLQFAASAIFDRSSADTSRAPVSGAAQGHYRLRGETFDAELAYDLPLGNDGLRLRPSLGVTHSHVTRGAVAETGGGAAALSVTRQGYKATWINGEIALRAGGTSAVQPWIGVGVRHLASGEPIRATGTLAGFGGEFTVEGTRARRTFAHASGGVSARLAAGLSVYLTGEVDVAQAGGARQMQGGFRYAF